MTFEEMVRDRQSDAPFMAQYNRLHGADIGPGTRDGREWLNFRCFVLHHFWEPVAAIPGAVEGDLPPRCAGCEWCSP
jgi:hypothetical protein